MADGDWIIAAQLAQQNKFGTSAGTPLQSICAISRLTSA
jgi:hypothetical protein